MWLWLFAIVAGGCTGIAALGRAGAGMENALYQPLV
jgi:hypothetical protein